MAGDGVRQGCGKNLERKTGLSAVNYPAMVLTATFRVQHKLWPQATSAGVKGPTCARGTIHIPDWTGLKPCPADGERQKYPTA